MNDLFLYFIVFSVRGEKDWGTCAGYIFLQEETHALELLKKKYGDQFVIRSLTRVPVEEGMILYGERWRTVS